jgi:hypothetical protein
VSVKPVTVSVANHERFTDHFLVDWETSGPRQGVGARARMRVRKPGPDDWLEMEVISAERPRRSAEQSTSAQGRRVTRGTYELEKTDDGGTGIFELAWLQAPTGERLIGPITRAVTRRANAKALRRLAELLAAKGEREPGRE